MSRFHVGFEIELPLVESTTTRKVSFWMKFSLCHFLIAQNSNFRCWRCVYYIVTYYIHIYIRFKHWNNLVRKWHKNESKNAQLHVISASESDEVTPGETPKRCRTGSTTCHVVTERSSNIHTLKNQDIQPIMYPIYVM